MSKIIILPLIVCVLLFCQGNYFVIDPAKNAVWRNERGLSFMNMGDYYSAMEEFKLAIALNPESEVSAAFYNNLGAVYYEIGAYGSAAACFRKALEIKPYFLKYYENLVNAYKKQNNLQVLINEYEQRISRNRNDMFGFLMLGIIHKESGNKNLASFYLREFIKLAPDFRLSEQIRIMIKELNY